MVILTELVVAEPDVERLQIPTEDQWGAPRQKLPPGRALHKVHRQKHRQVNELD